MTRNVWLEEMKEIARSEGKAEDRLRVLQALMQAGFSLEDKAMVALKVTEEEYAAAKGSLPGVGLQYKPEVLEAMEEAERISGDANMKRYSSFSEAMEEVTSEAEDDVKCGRIAPITETFDDLRKMLQEGQD